LEEAAVCAPSTSFVLCSATHPKAFERWALAAGMDMSHVINSGRTLGDVRCVRETGGWV
jgi:hypothetical protein